MTTPSCFVTTWSSLYFVTTSFRYISVFSGLRRLTTEDPGSLSVCCSLSRVGRVLTRLRLCVRVRRLRLGESFRVTCSPSIPAVRPPRGMARVPFYPLHTVFRHLLTPATVGTTSRGRCADRPCPQRLRPLSLSATGRSRFLIHVPGSTWGANPDQSGVGGGA